MIIPGIFVLAFLFNFLSFLSAHEAGFIDLPKKTVSFFSQFSKSIQNNTKENLDKEHINKDEKEEVKPPPSPEGIMVT